MSSNLYRASKTLRFVNRALINECSSAVNNTVGTTNSPVSMLISNANKCQQTIRCYHKDSTKESVAVSMPAVGKCPYGHGQQAIETTTTPVVVKPFEQVPGPKAYPFIGNYLDLKKHAANTQAYFLDLCHQYGEVVKLSAFGHNIVIVSNPYLLGEISRKEERRTMLSSSRHYKQSRGYELAPVEMAIDENWNDIRQIFNIAMKPEFLDQIVVPQLTEMNSDFIRQLRKNFSKVGSNQYRLDNGLEATSRYAFDAIMKIFFGVKLNDEVEKTLPFEIDDFSKSAMAVLDLCIRLDYKVPFYKYFKTKEYSLVEETYDKVIGYARYCVERFGEPLPEGSKPRFKEILDARSVGVEKGSDKVTSVLSTFLQGGVDITSRIMNNIFYRLAHHPEYQEKIYQECIDILGEPTAAEVESENGLNITPEQYKKFKLVKQFVEEVFRFNSFAYVTFGRQLNSDMEVGGYNIPKESIIIFMNYYPSMKDEYVPQASDFIPERHDKKSPIAPKSMFSSIPFGVGARKCPGSRIANTELHFALINAVRNFKLTKENPNVFPEMSTDQSLFYIDTKKHPLYFHPRDHVKHLFD